MKRLESALLFVGIFLLYLSPTTDPDLGWHLRYGDHIWKTGTQLVTNTFSFLLPNYVWINHSWGYDMVAAALYNSVGFVGMSLAAALLVAMSVWLVMTASKQYRLGWLLGLVVFWYFTEPLLATGLKSQLISLFFTVCTWWLLPRYLYALPLVFLIWANMHGQFILGLGLLLLYAIGSPQRKKVGMVTLFSFLATLITPYGLRLHEDVLGYLASPVLSLVQEWQPWGLGTPKMLALLLYSFLLWWFILARKRKVWKETIAVLFLTILSIKSRRIIPLYLLISFPYFLELIEYVRQRLKIPDVILILVNRIGLALLLVVGVYSLSARGVLSQRWESYCKSDIRCSEGAVSFMRAHQIRGKLFNAYRLGGHLIYRYPEEKVFIDGRMTLWHDEHNTYPMQTYSTMVYALPGSRELFMQENFEYVLINREYPLARVLVTVEKWPVLYEDDYVLLFKNPLLESTR